jgi:transcriptional regulator with XRE-family HTH domain
MPATKAKPENKFAAALRAVRRARNVSQEELSELSSRTYVSTLERGLKSPTLHKVEQLSEMLTVHPLTLLMLSYAKSSSEEDVAATLTTVTHELAELRRMLD